MPTQKFTLISTDWQLISAGGAPLISFRGTDECLIFIGAGAKPAIGNADYFTLRNRVGAQLPLQLPAGTSVWGRSKTGSVEIEVLDTGMTPGGKQRYQLLTAVAVAGAGPAVGPIVGGDYIWRCQATTWTGVTVTLQFLDLDGVTWQNVKDSANADVTMSANGSKSVGVAEGSILRGSVVGTPAGLNSAIAGL